MESVCSISKFDALNLNENWLVESKSIRRRYVEAQVDDEITYGFSIWHKLMSNKLISPTVFRARV